MLSSPRKHPSSMSPTLLIRVFVASVLASVLPITSVFAAASSSSSSTSSLLSITGDLAPSLLSFTLVMLVASTTRVASAANYSASQLQAMMLPGAAGRLPSSNADLYARLAQSNGPSARHLNPEMLLTRMGSDFKRDWMSVEEPSQSFRARTNAGPTDADSDLVKELRELSFSYTDKQGNRRTMSSDEQSVVKLWLLERATCQVHYTWNDMGGLFWPRWVKHGRCDTESPCSWPSGMHCAAGESKLLRLLHWQCRRPDSNGRRVRHVDTGRHRRAVGGGTGPRAGDAKIKRSGKMQCRWKKVPYPVTSECFCSC